MKQWNKKSRRKHVCRPDVFVSLPVAVFRAGQTLSVTCRRQPLVGPRGSHHVAASAAVSAATTSLSAAPAVDCQLPQQHCCLRQVPASSEHPVIVIANCMRIKNSIKHANSQEVHLVHKNLL